MGDSFEIIKARIKDDTSVLIDRMMRSQKKEVVFALPLNSILALNLNSLILIKEEARSVGKNVYFITLNKDVLDFARNNDIKAYENFKELGSRTGFLPPESLGPKFFDIIPRRVFEEVYKRTDQEEISDETTEYQSQEVKEEFPAPFSESIFEPETSSPTPENTRPDLTLEIEQETPKYQDNQDNFEKNLELFYQGYDRSAPDQSKKLIFSRSKNIVLVLLFIALFAGFGSFFILLPKATVSLLLKSSNISTVIPVTVSKNASAVKFGENVIPGQYFILSKTGSKNFILDRPSDSNTPTSSKARGTITVYNAYSAAPQKLIARTRFETKEGKVFRTPIPVIIPGAKLKDGVLTPSSIGIQVVADAPGEIYNIGPSYFTIPGFKNSLKYAGFYGKSSADMSGGRTGVSNILSSGDLENAKSELKNELSLALKIEALNTRFDPEQFRLVDGASEIKIDSFKSSAQLGSKVDSFILTMKVTWQAMIFKESDVKAVIEKSLKEKSPDLVLAKIDLGIVYPRPILDWPSGEMLMAVSINKDLGSQADVSSLKQELAGKDETAIRSVISQKHYIDSAVINLWPFWVRRAPQNTDKIDIKVQIKNLIKKII